MSLWICRTFTDWGSKNKCFFINYHKVIIWQCRTIEVWKMSSCSVQARKSNLLNPINIQKRNQKSRKKETIFKIILNGKLVFPFSYCACGISNIYHTYFECKRIRLSKIYGLLQNQNSFSALHMRKIFPFEFFFFGIQIILDDMGVELWIWLYVWLEIDLIRVKT